MHKNFGEWYRTVSIEPTADLLQKRWAGVNGWVLIIRSDDSALLETVRIFQGFPEKTSRERFLAALSKPDPAFPQRNNELEQRVLAGASLLECVLAKQGGLRAAIIAGTALEASRLRVSEEALPELTGEVLSGLHAIAKRERKRNAVDPVVLSPDAEKLLTTTLPNVMNAADHNVLKSHVGSMLQTLHQALQRSERALKSVGRDLRCADEETNILWWLLGGSSRDLNKPWNALKDAAPLVAAYELADLTDVALGPQDAAALLERVVLDAVGKSKNLPIHAYVNAVPEGWAKDRAAKAERAERAFDLTPFSFALSCRSKSDTSSWQQFFEANSGLKAATTLAPQQAAKLAYVEAVLLGTLAKTES